MDEHFITEIEIENFKCFENFKASGFKRVNLIGGKNNVGKTAFMEACYINIYSQDIESTTNALYNIKFMRENLEYVEKNIEIKKLFESTPYFYSKSNNNSIKFNISTKNGKKEYLFDINHNKIAVNSNEFSYQLKNIKNIKFIDKFGFTNQKLKEVYIAVQRKDKEDTLYKYINLFDKNIEKFKIMGGETPECKIKSGEYRYINEFGDGLKHFISIICSLYACKNGYLFIDEIDNEIHYSKFDILWEIILTISKEQNVQVFATTHSKEVIASYARVLAKLKDENITFFDMGNKKDGTTVSITMNYERLLRYIELGNEVRGW